jgi:hypothetical protein
MVNAEQSGSSGRADWPVLLYISELLNRPRLTSRARRITAPWDRTGGRLAKKI